MSAYVELIEALHHQKRFAEIMVEEYQTSVRFKDEYTAKFVEAPSNAVALTRRYSDLSDLVISNEAGEVLRPLLNDQELIEHRYGENPYDFWDQIFRTLRDQIPKLRVAALRDLKLPNEAPTL